MPLLDAKAWFALVALLFLLVPAAAAQPERLAVATAVFYYPWYGTPTSDGSYDHWQQNGHRPPGDIASMFYPARGAYSSSDPSVVRAQMSAIARAGISEAVYSWWGKGSPEDGKLTLVLREAQRHGVKVAAHLEPYDGRTVAGTADDIAYLRNLGIRDFFVYHATDVAAADWKQVTSTLTGVRLFAQTPLAGFAKSAGFDGIYTYDALTYRGRTFARICGEAHAQGLLCAPSVSPGYTARRATGDRRVLERRDGKTYDGSWRAALDARADFVTITSYNEWLEGTQIEPAIRKRGYLDYEGAWGKRGVGAQSAYLARTRFWTRTAAAKRQR
jgi:glycoprotein endo-alpha-1,2-mannosidase